MQGFIPYLGGKSLLASKLVPMIPKHRLYCEPFAGGAWMLFKKPKSRHEIINDINGELINLFRVVKTKVDEFKEQFKYVLIARDEFNRLVQADLSELTDVERAYRLYYLLKTGFSSQLNKHHFSIRACNERDVYSESAIQKVHDRLKYVHIENMDYYKLVNRVNNFSYASDTFFYVDPPYYGREDFYGKNVFERDDFYKLACILGEIKGKFMLSINDTPEVREIFGRFNCIAVDHSYSCMQTSLTGGKAKKLQELVYVNYDVHKEQVDLFNRREVE